MSRMTSANRQTEMMDKFDMQVDRAPMQVAVFSKEDEAEFEQYMREQVEQGNMSAEVHNEIIRRMDTLTPLHASDPRGGYLPYSCCPRNTDT